MKTKKAQAPLEAEYSDGKKSFRIHFHELDREFHGSVADSMEYGRFLFLTAKGEILASCEPKQVAWIQVR